MQLSIQWEDRYRTRHLFAALVYQPHTGPVIRLACPRPTTSISVIAQSHTVRPLPTVLTLILTRINYSALACVDVRKMWIRLRRIIALAELIGLPRASKSLSAESTPHHRSAAAIWESICVVDRLAGMMFNLPSATKSYPPLHMSVMSDNGSVNVQAYVGRLTEIALSVQDLDNTPSSERPGFDQLAKVFAVDERLRNLAESTPVAWWTPSIMYMTAERLVQYWHHYFTVRTHLRLALADDESGRFRLNYNTCLSASQTMAQRYIDLRPLLPAGFFACKTTDLQILTAAIFLTFDSSKVDAASTQYHPQASASGTLAEQLADSMETASKRAGGEVAEKGVVALRSLQSLMGEQPSDSNQKEMSLNLPMLGKISVTRKVNRTQPEQLYAAQPVPGWQRYPVPADEVQLQDNVTMPFWSMDVMDEDFAFVTDSMSGDNFGLPEFAFTL